MQAFSRKINRKCQNSRELSNKFSFILGQDRLSCCAKKSSTRGEHPEGDKYLWHFVQSVGPTQCGFGILRGLWRGGIGAKRNNSNGGSFSAGGGGDRLLRYGDDEQCCRRVVLPCRVHYGDCFSGARALQQEPFRAFPCFPIHLFLGSVHCVLDGMELDFCQSVVHAWIGNVGADESDLPCP